MSTLTTKSLPEAAGPRHGIVGVFYLLTFLTGGFFLLAGGKLGGIIEVTAGVFYLAAMVLFYSISKRA